MKLIKNALVYAPAYLGKKDVLLAGNKIVVIDDDLTSFSNNNQVSCIDASDKILVPGFVDSLVHITGGGGEGGFATRTPEMHVTEAFKGGVTTVIGVLGTDAVSRSLENLLAKAHSLETQFLSVFCYTGSYHIPAVTVTGCIKRDIMFIEKFIGIGEVAIADHRSSQLTYNELAKLTSEARVAGMLSGKSGIVSIHLGDETSCLTLLREVTEKTDIPINQFYPTHINRSKYALNDGIEFALSGGFIDFTTSTTEQIIAQGEIPAAEALATALKSGVDIKNLTMSSDGNASLPVFDGSGNLVDLQVGRVSSLHQSMVDAVKQFDVPFELALQSITSSPAAILALNNKGRIAINADADVVLLNRDTLAIDSVISSGELVINKQVVVHHYPF